MNLEAIQNLLEHREPGLIGAERRFAVLVPLIQTEAGFSLLYEVRAQGMRRQPGEVCFPGGQLESDESPEDCALRETWEELGIPRKSIRILGRLDLVAHRANFIMYPILGVVDSSALDALRPNPAEVGDTFLTPLSWLRDNPPADYRAEVISRMPENFPYEAVGISADYRRPSGRDFIPVYPSFNGHTIWGLTGRITRHLLALLQSY